MSHLIATADALQDILDHEFVIDVTLYHTEGIYHGKAYTVGGHSPGAEHESLSEMLLDLHQQINELFNAERN